MGLSLFAYCLLATTGAYLLVSRKAVYPRPGWLRPLHYGIGGTMIMLVLLLLAIGVIGTLGHFGSLGHSVHLPAGLIVVGLTLLSGWSAIQISPQRPWARSIHLGTNVLLLIGFICVSLTGWTVVQKYLP